MNLLVFKSFIIRFFENKLVRAIYYYALLLIGSFFLLGGLSLLMQLGEYEKRNGWICAVIGSIAIAFIVKFQGWFFPKTENSEAKAPTKVSSGFAYAGRSILFLIIFYFLYLLCFVVFYLTHFAFIHHVLWYGMEGQVVLHEWCPLGEHAYQLSEETFDYLIFVPFVLSLFSTIAFNHCNKIVRVILFILPIVGVVFFLYLSTRYSDEINEKARKSMSEAERSEYE